MHMERHMHCLYIWPSGFSQILQWLSALDSPVSSSVDCASLHLPLLFFRKSAQQVYVHKIASD